MAAPSIGHNIVINLQQKTAKIISTQSDGSKQILTIFANSPNKQDNTFNAGDRYTITDENGKTVTNPEFDTGAVANFLQAAMNKTPEQLKSLKEVKLSGISFNPANAGEKRLFEYAKEMNETAEKIKETQEKEEICGAIADIYRQLGNSRNIGNYYPTNNLSYTAPTQNYTIGTYPNILIENSAGMFPQTSPNLYSTSYNGATRNPLIGHISSMFPQTSSFLYGPLLRDTMGKPLTQKQIIDLVRRDQWNRLSNMYIQSTFNNPYLEQLKYDNACSGLWGSVHRQNELQNIRTNGFILGSGGIPPLNTIPMIGARQDTVVNELATLGLTPYHLNYFHF